MVQFVPHRQQNMFRKEISIVTTLWQNCCFLWE